MRFNDGDIEVLIKEKGTTDTYKMVKHEEICNIKDLPEYDHKQEWKTRKDKPVRTVRMSPNRGDPPSLAGQVVTHPISRNSSLEQAPRKKLRRESSQEEAADVAMIEDNDTIDEDTAIDNGRNELDQQKC